MSWTKRTQEELRRSRVAREKRRIKARIAVKNFLLDHPCVDCHQTDIDVLQFDHIKGRKISSISKMIKDDYSIKSIFKEIAKCEVRCANCHVRKTSKDFEWNKNLIYCDKLDMIKLKDELDEESWKYR